MKEVNEIWSKYEKCKDYILKKGLVGKTNKYWNFYLGNQWAGCDSGGEELPFMNFIKPVIKYKVSTVGQNNVIANYSDSMGREDMTEVYKRLNQMFSSCWEKAEMDTNVWRIIKEAAIAGDSYAFFGTADVRDVQILSNMSVLLGDEQNPKIQEQPFIIIRERLPVKSIKEMARNNGIEESEIERITSDEETDYLIHNKEDVEHNGDDGKATSLLYMQKKDGIVHIARCTETCIYQPLTSVIGKTPTGAQGRGLKLYPLVNFIWEDCPNNARGQGEVKELIPNQIEVNKTLARISMSIKMAAFPRLAYDKNAIQNPDDLEKTGVAIEVQGTGAQSINQMISYLSPMTMAPDARVFFNDMMEQTRELAGASDTSMGQISDPTRVAASAIIAIRDQSALPLNEQVAKSKKFTEDLARLWPEIWFTYNPDGFTVANEVDGAAVSISITAEEMDSISPDIRVDISQDTPWTKNAEQQVVDGLLERQQITFEEYVELSPDNGPVPKSKLNKIFEERQAAAEAQPQEPAMPPEEGAQENEVS